MFTINARCVASVCVSLLALGIATSVGAQALKADLADSTNIGILPPRVVTPLPPDYHLYTQYTVPNTFNNVYLTVCGSTADSEGCYGSAVFGPFGHAGALIEGNEVVSGGTVTRNIYVVDDGDTSAGGTGVKLYVYLKTDVVTASSDTVTTSLVNTVNLPLVTGRNVVTHVAADNGYLFIGTSLSQSALRISKSDLSMLSIPGGAYLTSITANKYGHVIATFGQYFAAYDPEGNLEESGGGNEALVDASNGLSTVSLYPASASSPSQPALPVRINTIEHHLKKMTTPVSGR